MTTELFLQCDDSRMCTGTHVSCPASNCSIGCGAEQACNDMRVTADKANSLLFYCTGFDANAHGACAYTELSAKNASKVELDCIGKTACNAVQLKATNAQSVSVSANTGSVTNTKANSLMDSTIDVTHARTVDVWVRGFASGNVLNAAF